MRKKIVMTAGVLAIAGASASSACAQSSSLLQHDLPAPAGAVLHLSDASWIYQELPPPPREIQKYDIITVRVDEKSTVTSKGSMDRKRNGTFDAQVKSWFTQHGLTAKASSPSGGEPSASVSLDSQLKAEAEVKSSDGLSFTISAMVLEIRPNGTLVIEGHRRLKVNDENWELKLTGTIRKEDVPPNNLVTSDKIADLDLSKTEAGDVRDGYNRGWFLKAYDKHKPF